jgi:hypothetical protein
MNYSELTSALAKSLSTLSDSDLRSLNSFLVNEINDRVRQKRNAVRSTVKVGDRVIINDPRCAGKTYIIEKFSAKSAVLREADVIGSYSANGMALPTPKIRATTTLLQLA